MSANPSERSFARLADAEWLLGESNEAILQWARKQIGELASRLCGEEPCFTDTLQGRFAIVVGSPDSNRVLRAATERGLLDLSQLWPDDFVLKSATMDGTPVLFAAGTTARAAVYAVFELFEQLGCTFLISHDQLSALDADLTVPALDLVKRTDCSWRGIFFGGYCIVTTSMMSLPDYEAMFDQMVKLKMNRVVFYYFENEPFTDYTFRGERKLVGDISHPDSGYISYGRHFTGSFRVADLPAQREKFDREKIAPLEFQTVGSSDEALDTAKTFTQQIIALANERGIGVWLTVLPQFVPPNLSKYTRPMPRHHAHWSAHLSCTDPAVGPLNRARLQGLLEAYPGIEGIFLGIPEGFFDDPYPETQELIEREWDNYAEALAFQKEYWGKFWPGEERQKKHMEADIAFTEIIKQTIAEAKELQPDLRLGILTICKAYLLTHLHKILPEDMPFLDFESRALWTVDGAPLHLFQRMPGRECALVPRAVDDGSLAGLQFPLWQYSQDRFLQSSVENGTAGLMAQTTHIRGNEHSLKYLADGMWDGPATPEIFYAEYSRRIFGAAAASSVTTAFQILEQSDESLGGRGQRNMPWNMVPEHIGIMRSFKDFSRPFHAPPFESRFVEKCEARAAKFSQAIVHLDHALEHFSHGQEKATPAGRAELAYLIARTRGYREHLQALTDFTRLYRHYFDIFDLLPNDLDAFKQSLTNLVDEAKQLEAQTRLSAKYFADCVEHTTDLAVLWMISHKMVLGSACLRQFLENIQSFYEGREYWSEVGWDKLFGHCAFPPHSLNPTCKTTTEASYEPG